MRPATTLFLVLLALPLFGNHCDPPDHSLLLLVTFSGEDDKPGVTAPINNVYGITADKTVKPDLLNTSKVNLQELETHRGHHEEISTANWCRRTTISICMDFRDRNREDTNLLNARMMRFLSSNTLLCRMGYRVMGSRNVDNP